MEKEQRYQVVVHNKVQDGYRRAGVALQKGPNLLMDITQAQIDQFKSDPRLVFDSQDPMPTEPLDDGLPKRLPENGESDETQHSLDGGLLPADLTVEQLKAKLAELGVEFAGSAKKADLVALLEAALAPKDGE